MANVEYRRFKIRTERLSGQGLKEGDLVRREYAEGTGMVSTVLAVLSTGTELIADAQGQELEAPYFIGALIEGQAPHSGEPLDFVRTTSLLDPARGGALFFTAAGAAAPYMDAVDGAGTERSLCFPSSIAAEGEQPDKGKYTVIGRGYLTPSCQAPRICRLERNDMPAPDGTALGLRQHLGEPLGHPEQLLVGFRTRASEPMSGVAVLLGDTEDLHTDAAAHVEMSQAWTYHLLVMTLEYPAQYTRVLTIDLAGMPCGSWCEIAELNILRQSDAVNLAAACKVRVGKITGIADPLFGVLDGYGAYFQNLYATRNVNIAGTLTAGDESGFAGTFYVGRIHKNCLLNSLACRFASTTQVLEERAPAGVGLVHRLTAGDHLLSCQSAAWAALHAGRKYCFSFWCRSEAPTTVTLRQGGVFIGSLPSCSTWRRQYALFTVQHEKNQQMDILLSLAGQVDFTSPQLEAGEHPTLYQPTDEVLHETDDYGAWFSRGGIGGTIQHPLLELRDDGAIASRNGSFVINADGTGYMAGGRFAWTKSTIDLKGVTMRWEDFDQAAQQELRPKGVSIFGPDTFHFTDALVPEAQPSSIMLVATEQNFTAEARWWEYLCAEGVWKPAGSRDTTLQLTPDFHAWEGREVLTLRYQALYHAEEYVATYTLTKQYDGQSAYSVYIHTDRGAVLQNGMGATTLMAHIMRGAEEVTEFIPDERFQWSRQSDDPDSDVLWNASQHRGRTLTIGGDDVSRKAAFTCEVTIK